MLLGCLRSQNEAVCPQRLNERRNSARRVPGGDTWFAYADLRRSKFERLHSGVRHVPESHLAVGNGVGCHYQRRTDYEAPRKLKHTTARLTDTKNEEPL